MNTFEKVNAVTRALPALDTPVMKIIRQQQEILEGFQRQSANHLNVFKQTATFAKYSPVAALSALPDLRAAAITLPKQVDLIISAKAAATISKPLTYPAIAALDGLRETVLSFPTQTDWLGATKSLALSNKVQATMLAKSLSGLGSALAIGIDDRLLYPSKHLKLLRNAGVLASVAAIPTNTLASLRNIVEHQAKLNSLDFRLAAGFSEYGRPLGISKSIYPDTLQSTLKALSRTLDKKAFEFTTTSIIGHQWDAVENFETLFNEAIELTECIGSENGDVEELDDRIKRFIDAARVFLAHNLAGANWISILFILMSHFNTIRDVVDVFMPKPELATKEDVRDTQQEVRDTQLEIERLRIELRNRIEHLVTNHKCNVYLKPNSRSLRISKLPSETEVQLLDTNRRWAQISFSDEKDNFEITGWVLKKYLRDVKETTKLDNRPEN